MTWFDSAWLRLAIDRPEAFLFLWSISALACLLCWGGPLGLSRRIGLVSFGCFMGCALMSFLSPRWALPAALSFLPWLIALARLRRERLRSAKPSMRDLLMDTRSPLERRP